MRVPRVYHACATRVTRVLHACDTRGPFKLWVICTVLLAMILYFVKVNVMHGYTELVLGYVNNHMKLLVSQNPPIFIFK